MGHPLSHSLFVLSLNQHWELSTPVVTVRSVLHDLRAYLKQEKYVPVLFNAQLTMPTCLPC